MPKNLNEIKESNLLTNFELDFERQIVIDKFYEK